MHPNASKCSKLVQICPIYYYSYNSGGEEHGHEIYFKTSSNSFKLLQTPPNTFQTLPNPVQMRPNTSKCVETCPNLKMLQTCPKLSKLVQTCPNLSKLVQTCPNMIRGIGTGGQRTQAPWNCGFIEKNFQNGKIFIFCIFLLFLY